MIKMTTGRQMWKKWQQQFSRQFHSYKPLPTSQEYFLPEGIRKGDVTSIVPIGSHHKWFC